MRRQSARGVVHVDEHRALWSAILERMFAAVDLDELAQTRPPVPRLIRPDAAAVRGGSTAPR